MVESPLFTRHALTRYRCSMLDMPVAAVDETALDQLVANHVAERRDLEFKSQLPGRSDEQVKEFLADVTSLANAHGGDLLFGIEEANGTASKVAGVVVEDVDAEILRLESILRTSVEPRLAGVRFQWVGRDAQPGVLMIRVPGSLAAPHRVTYKNSGRFFSRNSRGKYEMDVHELRQAFTESGRLPDRFRQLHMRAIEAAQGKDMPFAVNPDPTAVVSVMPLSLFREERDIANVRDFALAPINPTSFSWLDMIEGTLAYAPISEETGTVRSLALTHRSGRIDAAWTIGGVREAQRGKEMRLVFSGSFEEGLLEAAVGSQTNLGMFGVDGPWIVFASIVGARNYIMVLGDGYPTRPAFRDQVLLGEIRIDRIDEASLLSILQNFWLLFGQHRPANKRIIDR